ncbi:MAG: hypothetical protein ACLRPW_12980 [Intestinibacter sp.]
MKGFGKVWFIRVFESFKKSKNNRFSKINEQNKITEMYGLSHYGLVGSEFQD